MPREQNHAGQAAPKSLSSRGLLAICEALCPHGDSSLNVRLSVLPVRFCQAWQERAEVSRVSVPLSKVGA